MLSRIRDAGVVGAGGGGFPTATKYEAKAEVVIANGAECEPLARNDQHEMVEQPAEILRGLQIAIEITGAPRGIVALKAKTAGEVLLGSPALATQLEKLGLIDEYQLVVHPVLAGHGPTLLPGLEGSRQLELLATQRFAAGQIAMHYRKKA